MVSRRQYCHQIAAWWIFVCLYWTSEFVNLNFNNGGYSWVYFQIVAIFLPFYLNFFYFSKNNRSLAKEVCLWWERTSSVQKTVNAPLRTPPRSKTAWCASETSREGMVLWMRRNLICAGMPHPRHPARRRTITTSRWSGQRRTNGHGLLGLLVVVRPLCW